MGLGGAVGGGIRLNTAADCFGWSGGTGINPQSFGFNFGQPMLKIADDGERGEKVGGGSKNHHHDRSSHLPPVSYGSYRAPISGHPAHESKNQRGSQP